jgi:hypothetical protein
MTTSPPATIRTRPLLSTLLVKAPHMLAVAPLGQAMHAAASPILSKLALTTSIHCTSVLHLNRARRGGQPMKAVPPPTMTRPTQPLPLPNGLIKVRRRRGQRHPQGAKLGSNRKLELMPNSKRLPPAHPKPLLANVYQASLFRPAIADRLTGPAQAPTVDSKPQAQRTGITSLLVPLQRGDQLNYEARNAFRCHLLAANQMRAYFCLASIFKAHTPSFFRIHAQKLLFHIS